jgi:ComB9 competence protein
MPVPDTVLKQAELQAEGIFPKMKRGAVGGQVQDAWDDSKPEEGVIEFNHCPKCTYKVRLREYMVTVIEFPEGETIERADTGDMSEFTIQQRGARRLSIKPAGYGVDSNLIVYGKSGAIYPIYMRAERFNSTNVPDLLVRISGKVRVAASAGSSDASKEPPAITVAGVGEASLPPMAPPDKKAGPKASAVAGLKPDPKPPSNDFVQDAPFDPNKLRGWGEYEVWAGGTAGETLKPATVFRDDYFTYIRFDDKWNDMEYPTAYAVVDGIDELVNTRRQGQTLIVESTNKLITLKSGKSFLCIKYKGAS